MSFNWSNASYDAWATREPWGNVKEPEMNKEPIMATCEECKQEMLDNLGKWTGFVGTDGINEYIDFYCNDCIDHHSNNNEDDYEEYMEEIRLSRHDL